MLSVVITAWNEEKNLSRVIASIKDLADEIVVIDTESTDRTVEVAKAAGARVFSHKNTRIVEPVRNFSITKAKGDWVLLLDADEEVPASLASEIKRIIKDDTADYVRIPRKNLIFGRWVKTAHWWPDYVYRLFKKGSVSWPEHIHSIPITRGSGIDLPSEEDCSLIHTHYNSIGQYVDRLNRYTDVQADEKLKNHYTFTWADLIRKPGGEFLNQYYARGGYKEGLHGLSLALLQTFSELVLYLKLWEKSGFPKITMDSHILKAEVNLKRREFAWWYFESKIQSSSPVRKFLYKLLRRLSSI